ncbi:hypothetical protein [Nocardioides sp.]|uniref:hypothetical protein n=1 Tax=Nocardioides sp. TaxID=35761 RepID=UPI002735F0EB|nr:hypothetical protein [Nocardioides sp.]MDP3892027.1 hypothetical protein [Nocardioides sp.]
MGLFDRIPGARDRPEITPAPGERVLAWTRDVEGAAIAGTRDACYLPSAEGATTRIPWEQVEAADWDADAGRLRISEVGEWGERRPEHSSELEDPGRFLELVRERVTASVVLVRHVPLRRNRGVRVIARRAPVGDAALHWVYEFDEGIDPDDPEVRRRAEQALASARDEVGDTSST